VAKARAIWCGLALIALAGCGSPSSERAADATPSTSSSGTDASPQPVASSTASSGATPVQTGAGGTATPASSGGPGPAGSTPSPTPSATRITLKIVIKPCVQPGQTQVLTFHARPNMNVVVNTRYADNKDGQAHGGFDYGHATDSRGDYRLSWVVDPATPIGPADSLVGAIDEVGTGNGRGDFRVALRC
jgi:hypothetical protein